jgi:hypothetical protein
MQMVVLLPHGILQGHMQIPVIAIRRHPHSPPYRGFNILCGKPAVESVINAVIREAV